MICHIHHICAVSLHCALSGGPSDVELDWKICCNLSMCASLPHCVSTSDSSDVELDWMFCCIQHICGFFPHCVLADGSSDVQLDEMNCRIHHICAVSFHCELACGSSNPLQPWMICCIVHKCATLLQWDSTYVSVQFAVVKDLTHVARLFIHNFEEVDCSPSRFDNYWKMCGLNNDLFCSLSLSQTQPSLDFLP